MILAGYGTPVNRGRCRCARKRARELPGGVLEVGIADDGVASIHALGLVAGDLHRDRPRDAGALEVPHRRSPEVVPDAARYAGGLARGGPRLPEIATTGPQALLAAEIREQVGDDAPSPLLEGVHALKLGLEERFEFWGQVDDAAVIVLRGSRVQP